MAVIKRIAKGHSDGLAIVIGNDTAGVSTGGGGVACACKASLDSLPHELGHALGGLRDEYDFEPGTDPNRHIAKGREANVPVKELRPNLMAGSSKDEVLERAYWKYWMDAGPTAWWNGSKVSAFEGANETPFNVWRPQASCKMRSVGTNFCVVCMEVMVKKIYRFVRPFGP